MSTHLYIEGVKRLTLTDEAKIQIIEKCQQVGVDIPEELRDFSAVSKIDLTSIEDFDFVEYWQDEEYDDIYGQEIIIDKVPKDVERIRIYRA